MKFIKRCNFLMSLNSYSRLYRNNAIISLKRNITHSVNCDPKTAADENEFKVSTLYVPGRYAGEMYQIIKPLIDVNYIERNMTNISASCSLRGVSLDLHQAVDVLKKWASKREEYQILVDKIRGHKDEMKRLRDLKLNEEVEATNKIYDECLNELKLLKEKVFEIEDISMPLVQNIPNIVDPCTPLNNNSVKIQIEPSVQQSKSPSHVDLLSDLLQFSSISPTAYYLKGPLAELEISIQVYFSEKLQEAQFSPMSCADFCKSFIVEATGLDPYSYDQCIPLKSDRKSKIGQNFNLIGGASFQSFCAYFINMNTEFETLPAKYFAVGRHYKAGNRNSSSPPSLFSVVQSSRIQGTVLTDNLNEKSQFESFLGTLLSCYSSLNIPFQIVDIAAPHLNSTESRRIQLELWSPSQQKFVKVAHASQRNDFISRRLHITYGEKYTVHGFCSMVEGVVVDIPVLLGCLIENHTESSKSIDFTKINNLFNI